jgi:DNA-binding GntR family transcriptional regulator
MRQDIDLDPNQQSRPNLRDVAANHIRNRIFAGDLRPGTRLDQDGIAADLGISKLPVREAILILEREGLLDGKARRGSYVAMLQPEDFFDHYRIFATLTGMAAERAATRISGNELDALAALLARMEQWDESNRDSDTERLNFRFHRIVNRAGGSRRLNVVLKALAAGMPEQLYHRTRGWTAAAQAEHREILAALKARDPYLAREAASRHVEQGGREVIASLHARGFWADAPGSGEESTSASMTLGS